MRIASGAAAAESPPSEFRPVAGSPREQDVDLPAIFTAKIAVFGDGDLLVEALGRTFKVARDPSVHPAVLEGAHRRGERVLIERRNGGDLVLVGALHTQPIPGIDAADEYHIEAGRIEMHANEISLATRAAAITLRAVGEIESYAERIVSRAEGAHKIIGRILRLN